MKKVAIIMGSDSDLPVAQKAVDVLKSLEIPYEVHIISAHRTPDAAAAFAKGAGANGFGVLIAIAGMAAHLGGVLAAYTVLPVIGVPCRGGAADGLDALLATVQMPSGVPVATVALGGGGNAALLAAQMLALADEGLSQALQAQKQQMSDAIAAKDAALQGKL